MTPVEGWTEGRFNAFITSVLRAGMRKFPNKWKALEAACTGQGLNAATGRKAKLYKCASCGKLFVAKNVEVDHIAPVVDPVMGFTTWDSYIERLFCTTDNLQVLDKTCHKQKTSIEKSLRSPKKRSNSLLKESISTSSKPSRKSSRVKKDIRSGQSLTRKRKPTSGAG